MKRVALLSTGFLRNYQFFLQSELYSRLRTEFDVSVYLSVWNEDGYGTNAHFKYTNSEIPEAEIRASFGDNLRSLIRQPFKTHQREFVYSPVRELLADEPYVLEKYRSKFFRVQQAQLAPGYDAYFHTRFDFVVTPELTGGILNALATFDAASSPLYTSADLYQREGCFGDTFQIGSYQHMRWLQGFYDKLYAPEYLDLPIRAVPERILEHYANESGIARTQIPGTIELNRKR
jgi:hypothetical protein